MGGDVSNLLVDENGNKKQWGEFLKDYKKINGDYNVHWLSAEYNLAQRQASAARQWQDWQRDKHVYPNLEYMPSKSANPSEQHKLYYGIIKPIDDPIWNYILPPSRWNCDCWLKQTREDPTEHDVEVPTPPAGIVGNPGKTGMIFSPDHPYIPKSKAEKQEVRESFNQLRNALNEEYIDFKAKKGKVRVSMNADPDDYLDNFRYAKNVSDQHPGVFKILAHSNKQGVKNPEFNYKGFVGDRTAAKTSYPEKYINNSFSDKMGVKKQLRSFDKTFIALDFGNILNEDNVLRAAQQLYGKFKRYETVHFVICRKGNKTVILSNGSSIKDMSDKITKGLL